MIFLKDKNFLIKESCLIIIFRCKNWISNIQESLILIKINGTEREMNKKREKDSDIHRAMFNVQDLATVLHHLRSSILSPAETRRCAGLPRVSRAPLLAALRFN